MDIKQYLQDIRPQLKDTFGRFRTESLFLETSKSFRREEYPPVFTLKDREYKGLPSIKRIYMSYNHIPGLEYEFASDVFGSWAHWVKIYDGSKITPYVEIWRDELEIAVRAKALKAIMENALMDGAKGSSSAKYLAEASWRGSSRGRPSKEEVKRELKVQAGIAKHFDEDLERIGLSVISGGKR